MPKQRKDDIVEISDTNTSTLNNSNKVVDSASKTVESAKKIVESTAVQQKTLEKSANDMLKAAQMNDKTAKELVQKIINMSQQSGRKIDAKLIERAGLDPANYNIKGSKAQKSTSNPDSINPPEPSPKKDSVSAKISESSLISSAKKKTDQDKNKNKDITMSNSRIDDPKFIQGMTNLAVKVSSAVDKQRSADKNSIEAPMNVNIVGANSAFWDKFKTLNPVQPTSNDKNSTPDAKIPRGGWQKFLNHGFLMAIIAAAIGDFISKMSIPGLGKLIVNAIAQPMGLLGKFLSDNKKIQAFGAKIAPAVTKGLEALKKVGQVFEKIPVLGKLFSGLGKVGGKVVSGGAKLFSALKGGITKVAGKLGSFMKKIPFVSGLIGIYLGVTRIKKGGALNIFQGIVDIISGVAGCFPGIGTAISIPLDVMNLLIDIWKNKQSKGAEPEGKKGMFSELFGKIKSVAKSIWAKFTKIFFFGPINWLFGEDDGDGGTKLNFMKPVNWIMDKFSWLIGAKAVNEDAPAKELGTFGKLWGKMTDFAKFIFRNFTKLFYIGPIGWLFGVDDREGGKKLDFMKPVRWIADKFAWLSEAKETKETPDTKPNKSIFGTLMSKIKNFAKEALPNIIKCLPRWLQDFVSIGEDGSIRVTPGAGIMKFGGRILDWVKGANPKPEDVTIKEGVSGVVDAYGVDTQSVSRPRVPESPTPVSRTANTTRDTETKEIQKKMLKDASEPQKIDTKNLEKTLKMISDNTSLRFEKIEKNIDKIASVFGQLMKENNKLLIDLPEGIAIAIPTPQQSSGSSKVYNGGERDPIYTFRNKSLSTPTRSIY